MIYYTSITTIRDGVATTVMDEKTDFRSSLDMIDLNDTQDRVIVVSWVRAYPESISSPQYGTTVITVTTTPDRINVLSERFSDRGNQTYRYFFDRRLKRCFVEPSERRTVKVEVECEVIGDPIDDFASLTLVQPNGDLGLIDDFRFVAFHTWMRELPAPLDTVEG